MSLHHAGGLYGRRPHDLTSQDKVLLAALECFVERGYHGTTIRQIATRTGVSVPGLYHHFPSKLAVLERLIDDTMDDLIETTATALRGAGPELLPRFKAVVDAHVRFHCERVEESFVGNTELRSLSAKSLRRVLGKRDRQQRMFDDLIEDGVKMGIFDVGTPKLASRAIVTMCTGVANWYQRSGPLSPDQIVDTYRELALGAVGYEGVRREARERPPVESVTPLRLAGPDRTADGSKRR